jgi:hypothetical protein
MCIGNTRRHVTVAEAAETPVKWALLRCDGSNPLYGVFPEGHPPVIDPSCFGGFARWCGRRETTISELLH